jgi:multisubunit Na+/H+ antiporter MnhE subunit
VPNCTSHISVYSTNINHFIWLVYRYTYRSDEPSAIGRNFHFCCCMVLNKPLSRKNVLRKLKEFLQLALIFIHCLPHTVLHWWFIQINQSNFHEYWKNEESLNLFSAVITTLISLTHAFFTRLAHHQNLYFKIVVAIVTDYINYILWEQCGQCWCNERKMD